MEYHFTLYDGKRTPPLRLYAVQGEAGARTVVFDLVGEGGSPVGASSTAFAYVAKNDGTLAVMDCQAAPGTVTFTLSLQACACPGVSRMYLQILNGDTETRWDNLELYVEPCDLEQAVASTDDLGPLGNLLTDPEYLQKLEDAYLGAAAQLEALMDQFSPKGEYSPDRPYQPLNLASWEGSSYVAKMPTQGHPPTDTAYWQLLAAKGKQGDPGEPGQKGDPGEPGKGLELGDVGGPYDSREALESAVPAPEEGSSYFVGAAAPYDLYRYREGGWQNLGPLQGAPGPAGATPEFQVGEVATLEPGSEATATLSGTAEQPVLNFGIPRGADGAPGQGGVTLQQVIDVVYPVGAVHITTANVNPGAYLSGTTWEAFGSGKTLVGVDPNDTDFNAVGKTGGSKAVNLQHSHATSPHVLTKSEIPSHAHGMTHFHTLTGAVANEAGPTGTIRVAAFSSSQVTGSFSKSGGYYNNAQPSAGQTWGAESFSLNGKHTHSLSGKTTTLDAETEDAGSGGSHSHGDTGEALGSKSVVQPYITCYFWMRVS